MAELKEDERYTQLVSEKNAALKEMESTYDSMINKTDQMYQAQIDAAKEYADKQSQLQQEQTDFEIQKIEQQKAEAEKEYQKQQSGAYVDWRKQSNQYGPEAEQMAAAGLQRTGYAESSQVAMYNAYQNRVATSRASFDKVVTDYNNAMTQARLQNNSVMAQIALEALQTQLKLTVEGFNYKNQLLMEKLAQQAAIGDRYYAREQDLQARIDYENELAAAKSYSSGGGSGANEEYLVFEPETGVVKKTLSSKPAATNTALIKQNAANRNYTANKVVPGAQKTILNSILKAVAKE